MSKNHADLIARAERILRGEYIVSEDGYPEGGEADMLLIRDLRDALVEAEAERCDNPLRSEITCAMLVRDNDHLRKRVAELEAQQSSLREKIEALRAEAEKNPFALAGSFLHGQETAFGIVLALLSDTETP